MKRCLRCGREFPDSYTFCDQDASPLPNARPVWFWPAIVAGAMATVAAVAGIAAPPLIRSYVLDRLKVEVTGLSLGHGVLSWLPGNVELDLRVRNDAPLSPTLRALHLECAAAGHNVVSLDWPSAPSKEVSIRKGEDTDLRLRVSPRHIQPESIIDGLRGNGGLPEVACKGPAEFAVWGIGFSQNLDFRKKI